MGNAGDNSSFLNQMTITKQPNHMFSLHVDKL